MANNTFQFAPIASMASDIIDKLHPHLKECPVVFRLFTAQKKAKGKIVLGTAAKLSPTEIHAYGECALRYPDTDIPWIHGLDYSEAGQLAPGFVISIYKLFWDNADETQRVALLDHELCHCITDVDADSGEIVCEIVGHDIEEFNAVIERHGDWKGEVARMLQSAKTGQPELAALSIR